MAKKNSPSFKYSDDELSNLINEADAAKARQPVSVATNYDSGSPLSSRVFNDSDGMLPKFDTEIKAPNSRKINKKETRKLKEISNTYDASSDIVKGGPTESQYGELRASQKSSSVTGNSQKFYTADEFTNPRRTGPDFSFVDNANEAANANSATSDYNILDKDSSGVDNRKPVSNAAKREAAKTSVPFSNSYDSTADFTASGVSESDYGKVRIGEKGSLIGGAGGSDGGRAPYYQAGQVSPVGGQSRSPLSFSPAMGGEIKSYTGEGSVLSDDINSMNSMPDEKMAQRAQARAASAQYKAPQQVLSGTGPLFAPAGGSKVGLSGMLSSGKVGRNAIAGAVVGAVAGGLNPAGDDGLFRGAAGGAAVGAVMGGLAGAVNAQMNPKGSETVSKGGRLFPGPMKDGAPPKIGRAGMLMSVGGVVGGLMGGLLGGSGRGKRHNTIDSNGWSKGTHPAYF